MDCSPPGSSVHGISQARILEWVAISFSRGSFPTQGLNLSLLHWQADSLPLSHQGSPMYTVAGPKKSKSSWDSQKRAKTSLTMPRRPFHSTLVTVSMTKVLLQIYTTLLSLVNMNSCAEKWVSSWCDLEKKKKSQVSEATKLPCDTLRPLGR